MITWLATSTCDVCKLKGEDLAGAFGPFEEERGLCKVFVVVPVQRRQTPAVCKGLREREKERVCERERESVCVCERERESACVSE